MTTIKAGDLVECLDNSPAHKLSKIMPELGRLYTVESTRWVDGGQSVRLKELPPSCFKGGMCACGNCGWDARRFRNVYRPEPRKIATLTAFLRTAEPCPA